MIDYLLLIIIIALMVFTYFKDREHNQQVNKLIKAIISKNAQDYTNLTLAENTELNMPHPNEPLGPIDDDLIPVGQADQDVFDKMIDRDLNPVDEDEESI